MARLLFGQAFDKCNPAESCEYLNTAGQKVIDPAECHNYYICIKMANGSLVPSSQPIPCQTNYHFLFDEDKPKDADCARGNTCTIQCTNTDCPSSCEPDNEEYYPVAYPGDCSKYYLCVPHQPPLVVDCPEDTPYFDGFTCGTSEFACCDTCSPYCSIAFSQIVDPYDCTRFYLCGSDPGAPDSPDSYPCGDGQYFDTGTGLCQPDNGVTCTSICTEETTLEYKNNNA